MTKQGSSRSKVLIGSGLAIAAVAVVTMIVLPAEYGVDPTGVGEATGLLKIANPDNPELERGMQRMAGQEVLALTDTRPEPAPGVTDTWTYELAPFESVEFKYTLPEGQPMSFRWEGTGPLHYDMHAHPFEGGEELTESYGIDDTQVMQGRYTPAFTGIHGWFWENRSMDNVTLRLEASGSISGSTIYSGGGSFERPIAGAEGGPQGAVAGHEMQGAE